MLLAEYSEVRKTASFPLESGDVVVLELRVIPFRQRNVKLDRPFARLFMFVKVSGSAPVRLVPMRMSLWSRFRYTCYRDWPPESMGTVSTDGGASFTFLSPEVDLFIPESYWKATLNPRTLKWSLEELQDLPPGFAW